MQLAQAHRARGDAPLAAVLRVPSRVAADLERAAGRFSASDLRAILRQFAEMDLRMKTTAVPDRAALAALALSVSVGGAPSER